MKWSIKDDYLYKEDEVRFLNILSLAYIGDSIYEIYIRNFITKRFGSINSGKLHLETIKYVNASFQSNVYFKIKDILNDNEIYYFKRGRNSGVKTIPKNASVIDYKNATGLECIIGYLYMVGNFERLDFIMDKIFSFI